MKKFRERGWAGDLIDVFFCVFQSLPSSHPVLRGVKSVIASGSGEGHEIEKGSFPISVGLGRLGLLHSFRVLG